MAGCKIVILLIVFQIVSTKPLFKEVHIKKNFDLTFKPHEFKPIAFIKEKWTHFGHLVTKHAIIKRSPLDLGPIPVNNAAPQPTFTVSLEKSFEAGPPPLLPPPPPPPETITPVPPMFVPELSSPAPASVPPPVSVLPPIYVSDHLSRLPVDGIEEVIVITPVPPPPPVDVLAVTAPAVIVTPILPPGPVPPRPLPPGPLPPVPPPPGIPKGLVQGNLLTDIGRVEEINAYLKAVEGLPPPIGPPVLPIVTGNSIEEVPKPVVDEKLNTSPLVKGSRLALYFGNILLQVMSEVISSARSAISQYSQPAPI